MIRALVFRPLPRRSAALPNMLARGGGWSDFSRMEDKDGMPNRRTPAKGVQLSYGGSNWVFLTVCTDRRSRWLADADVQSALHEIWRNEAAAWLVSEYLLMPDHLHLFCAPVNFDTAIERWISFWKNCFTKRRLVQGRFQRGGFHHRLRHAESYEDKWNYVRANPVRAGLVDEPDQWPFRGQVHNIRW
jgi:putative transposase